MMDIFLLDPVKNIQLIAFISEINKGIAGTDSNTHVKKSFASPRLHKFRNLYIKME